MGWSFPRVVHDAGEFTWAPAALVLVVPYVLINSQHLNPCEAGGVVRCGLQAWLDMGHTVFHVVTSCRARPAMVAPSKRNCRIAQRIARTPKRARGAHIRSSCSRNVTVWQVVSRHIQRRSVPLDPHRDPGPGRVDHLHHHTPVTLCDHPTTRAASKAIAGLYVEHQSLWGAKCTRQMEALQTDEQITPITTIKRHRAAGRVRHRPRSLTTAGEQVRSSPGTSTSTRNPRLTPGHPHSTRKSRQWQWASWHDFEEVVVG